MKGFKLREKVIEVGRLSPEYYIELEQDREKYWKRIRKYPGVAKGDKPSKEEIETAERVLKYAAECNYMRFGKDDALTVMEITTNMLKRNLGHYGWQQKEVSE